MTHVFLGAPGKCLKGFSHRSEQSCFIEALKSFKNPDKSVSPKGSTTQEKVRENLGFQVWNYGSDFLDLAGHSYS